MLEETKDDNWGPRGEVVQYAGTIGGRWFVVDSRIGSSSRLRSDVMSKAGLIDLLRHQSRKSDLASRLLRQLSSSTGDYRRNRSELIYGPDPAPEPKE